jgi:hypothetical protein
MSAGPADVSPYPFPLRDKVGFGCLPLERVDLELVDEEEGDGSRSATLSVSLLTAEAVAVAVAVAVRRVDRWSRAGAAARTLAGRVDGPTDSGSVGKGLPRGERMVDDILAVSVSESLLGKGEQDGVGNIREGCLMSTLRDREV